MKTKTIFTFTVLAIALVSFKTTDEKDIDNQLHNKIEYVFSDLINDVTDIIFLEENNNYFYKVEGFKENKYTSFIIKVSEDSYCSKELNTLHMDKISSNNKIEFCHWRFGICSPPIDDVVVRCGIYYDGECYPY